MSELNGITPLQLGAWINPNAKEGFTCTLDSPTSGMIRRGEDALTYLNKDQFYGMHLEYTPSQKFPLSSEVVTSVIALQFREKKEPVEAEQQWDFW